MSGIEIMTRDQRYGGNDVPRAVNLEKSFVGGDGSQAGKSRLKMAIGGVGTGTSVADVVEAWIVGVVTIAQSRRGYIVVTRRYGGMGEIGQVDIGSA